MKDGVVPAVVSRLPDWHPRLIEYLGATYGQPFAEGHFDCALFAAGAVEAMSGADLSAQWRGRYSSTRGGLRVLRKAGFADHVALVASLLEECPVAYARAGDVAVVTSDGQPCLGIVQGEFIYVISPNGAATVPLRSAVRAFRV